MKNKKIIIITLLLVVLIGGIAGFIFKGIHSGTFQNGGTLVQQTSTADPIDVVLDFYNPWLDAVKSTSTDPYTLGLAENPLLSPTLKASILATKGHQPTDIDPVLCQTTKPDRVTARVVSQTSDAVRILVLSKDKTQTAQSVFTLKIQDGGKYIDSITCTPGEFEVPREFTFDTEGYLLKESIPKPYDPKNWHLVFEVNGEKGHVAPLFFKADTSCIDESGATATCTPDQFVQATKVHVYGQMTELGVEVQKLEFLKQ